MLAQGGRLSYLYFLLLLWFLDSEFKRSQREVEPPARTYLLLLNTVVNEMGTPTTVV